MSEPPDSRRILEKKHEFCDGNIARKREQNIGEKHESKETGEKPLTFPGKEVMIIASKLLPSEGFRSRGPDFPDKIKRRVKWKRKNEGKMRIERGVSLEKLIVMADELPEYAHQLAVYLNGRRGFPYRAVVVASVQEIKGYLENGAAYAVLVSEGLEKDVLALGLPEDVRLFLFSETKSVQKESVLYRYQSAKEIEKRVIGSPGNRTHLPVFGVYSPAGGVWTELLSRRIAEGVSREKGRRALYLPFLPFGIYGRESGDGMSELLFYVRQRDTALPERLSSLRQEEEGMDSLTPVRWSTELQDITREDMEYLLHCVERKGGYGAAVLAVGQLDAAGIAILRCCDVILTPVWDVPEGHRIQAEFLKQLKEAGEAELLSRITEFPVKSGEEKEGFFSAVSDAVKKGGAVLAGGKGGNQAPDAGTAESVGRAGR